MERPTKLETIIHTVSKKPPFNDNSINFIGWLNTPEPTNSRFANSSSKDSFLFNETISASLKRYTNLPDIDNSIEKTEKQLTKKIKNETFSPTKWDTCKEQCHLSKELETLFINKTNEIRNIILTQYSLGIQWGIIQKSDNPPHTTKSLEDLVEKSISYSEGNANTSTALFIQTIKYFLTKGKDYDHIFYNTLSKTTNKLKLMKYVSDFMELCDKSYKVSNICKYEALIPYVTAYKMLNRSYQQRINIRLYSYPTETESLHDIFTQDSEFIYNFYDTIKDDELNNAITKDFTLKLQLESCLESYYQFATQLSEEPYRSFIKQKILTYDCFKIFV